METDRPVRAYVVTGATTADAEQTTLSQSNSYPNENVSDARCGAAQPQAATDPYSATSGFCVGPP